MSEKRIDLEILGRLCAALSPEQQEKVLLDEMAWGVAFVERLPDGSVRVIPPEEVFLPSLEGDKPG